MEINNNLLEALKELLNTHQNHSGYFTPDQAASYLGVSKSMVYKLGSQNVFPRYKPTHGLVYYKKEDLDNWIVSGRLNDHDLPIDRIIKKALDKNSRRK